MDSARYGTRVKRAAQTVAAGLGDPVTLQTDKQAGAMVIVTTRTSFTGVTTEDAGVTNGASSAAAAWAASNSAVPPWGPTPC